MIGTTDMCSETVIERDNMEKGVVGADHHENERFGVNNSSKKGIDIDTTSIIE